MKNQAAYSSLNDSELSHSYSLLSKFTSTWEKRAQIRSATLPTDMSYEIEKPDFLEELIPIRNCEAYRRLSEENKNSILSYGWLAYNAKTIAIESKLISPVCYDIIDGHIPGADDNESRKLIAETLTDESYHILLSHHAMTMTERNRKINRCIFTNFDLINKVKKLDEKYPEEWQKILIRLSVAIVSEIFISDYLKCLSYSPNIVTLNREITRAHRLDEIAHGRIFSELGKIIYNRLNNKQKAFFSTVLPYPAQYFASKELSIWNKILHKVCPQSANEIMEEAQEDAWFDLSGIDCKNLIALAEEIGIKNFSDNLASIAMREKIHIVRGEQ